MTNVRVIPIEQIDLRLERRPWAFAEAQRDEIDNHFACLQRDKPLWNGRVLLMCDHAFDHGVLRGRFFEADYASFLAWRDWGFPDKSLRNCFAAAALRGTDGGYILGVMSAYTANAGLVYFPCGTPDPDDVIGDRVDLDGSARRELFEETGIRADDCDVDPRWHAVVAGPRIALIKQIRAHETAETLRARILDHIAAAPDPELSDIHIARGESDVIAAMPPFVTAFLAAAWASRNRAPA